MVEEVFVLERRVSLMKGMIDPLSGCFGTFLLLCLMLAGCIVSSEVIHLKHPIKGDIVKCGPYTKTGNINSATQAAQAELRYCVSDFQRQGYERIAHDGL